MSNGTDKEKFIEFKAEVKLDLKYIREAAEEIKKNLGDTVRKVNKQCTEIAVLKTKVALYAGAVAGIISIISSIAIAIIVAAIKG